MPYTRFRHTERLFPELPGAVIQYSRDIKYNCMKKVKGHYPDANDMDRISNEYTFWISRTRTTAPGDTSPEYQSNDPISVTVNVPPEIEDVYGSDLQDVENKAYAKFIDQAKDSAQNANNLLEAGQSVSQVISHVQAISGSIHAIKRGDVKGAAKALGISISGSTEQRIKRRAKQAADRWLELHFGWEPLVQDIGSSIDIIQGTGKASRISEVNVKGGVSISGQHATSSTSNPAYGLIDNESRSFSWSCGCRMSASVAVENPNLALANQMGFVNPLSVAWEAVPFSFVVDWFSNVGQCLSAMTDFWGFQIHKARTSTFAQVMYTYSFQRDQWSYPAQLVKSEAYGIKHIHVNRKASIVFPVWKISFPKAISPARGATAISLLVQQMSRL